MDQKQWRKSHGLTQKEFGDMIGAALMTVWRYECTERVPSPNMMMRIMEVSKGEINVSTYYGNKSNGK